MEFDQATLQDIRLTLSYVEKLVSSAYEKTEESKKAKIAKILANPDRYYVDGDELMIHASHPLFDQYRADAKLNIPFDQIHTLDLIGDSSQGSYNAVYLEKTVRFLFPNATRFVSSSAYLHFAAFKMALEQRMQEAENSYENLSFGFSYGGDLYLLEYAGENGLDVYCAAHPFANPSFAPLPLSLANMDAPRIEARYIAHLSVSGDGISSYSFFRQGLYKSGVECLLDECENLKEIVIADDCPQKVELIKLAKERDIKVGE